MDNINFYELKEQIDKLESKVDYMHTRIYEMIYSTTKSVLEKEGMKEFAANTMKVYVTKHFEELISKITEVVVKKTTRKLKSDYITTKNFALFIDSEIKQIVRGFDCSHSSELIIKNKIEVELARIAEKVRRNIIEKYSEQIYNTTLKELEVK